MVELKDKACTSNEPTVLHVRSSNISREKSYGQGNESSRNKKYRSYPTGQGKSIETCLDCHTSGYSEPICWKKYPIKSPKF